MEYSICDLPPDLLYYIFSFNWDLILVSQRLCSYLRGLMRRTFLFSLLQRPLTEREIDHYLGTQPSYFASYISLPSITLGYCQMVTSNGETKIICHTFDEDYTTFIESTQDNTTILTILESLLEESEHVNFLERCQLDVRSQYYILCRRMEIFPDVRKRDIKEFLLKKLRRILDSLSRNYLQRTRSRRVSESSLISFVSGHLYLLTQITDLKLSVRGLRSSSREDFSRSISKTQSLDELRFSLEKIYQDAVHLYQEIENYLLSFGES